MNKKVLICDDEPGVREALKLILGDHYPLIMTDEGSQCLECLNNDKDIRLLLLDIKMPKMSGLDVLKEIKEKRHDVKVIIITGYKSVETAAEAVRLGACGYIVKPFDAKDILATVKNRLS